MTIQGAHGWAVVEKGEINVRSVSPHRRGAIVNFLLTDRKVVTLNMASDEAIENEWVRSRDTAEVKAVVIHVSGERQEEELGGMDW